MAAAAAATAAALARVRPRRQVVGDSIDSINIHRSYTTLAAPSQYQSPQVAVLFGLVCNAVLAVLAVLAALHGN